MGRTYPLAPLGLVVLFAILVALSAFTEHASYWVGFIDGRGTISHAYLVGTEPIASVILELPPDMVGSIAMLTVTPGWNVALEGNTMSVTGGLLYPGQSLTIEYHLTKYVEPGSKQLTAVSYFVSGSTAVTQGIVDVRESIILKILFYVEYYRLVATLLSCLGLLSSCYWLYRRIRIPPPPPPTVAAPPPPPEFPPTITTERLGVPCSLKYEWRHHSMDLNVWPSSLDGSPLLYRYPSDDPMPLKALAFDKHMLIHRCMCQEMESRKTYILDAKVRYEWSILSGRGGFIGINDGPTSRTETGEQVLYLPPDLSPDESEDVVIRVRAFHDDPFKPPDHEPVSLTYNVNIRRQITETGASQESEREFTDPGEVIDEYVYTFTILKEKTLGTAPPPDIPGTECLPERAWRPGTGIEGELRRIPEVCAGDHVVLEAEGNDMDELELVCIASGKMCNMSSKEALRLGDILEFEWTATSGEFPRGNRGKKVVWRAPPEGGGTVDLVLTMRDVGGQFDDENLTLKTSVQVRKLGVDLVKTPRDWLPKATAETTRPTAKIYVCRNNRWVYPGRRKFIRLKLKRISRERGFCMNYPPLAEANTNPDLFFHEERMSGDYVLLRDKTVAANCRTEVLAPNDNPAHNHHHLYAVSRKRLATARPVIRCEDYGAVGVLEARANCCEQIPARQDERARPCEGTSCCTGSNEIRIPRDDNGNDIADGATRDAAPDRDDDNNPVGDGNPGDGLTNYEEYRGFIKGGGTQRKEFARTDIRNKDIFILDRDSLNIGYFGRTGLVVHRLFDQSLLDGTGQKVINFNRGRHTGGEQHGIRLVREGLGGEARGRAVGGPGTPRVIDRVAIDTAEIAAEGLANMQERVIAHELGHAVNIFHHGQGAKHSSCGNHTERNSLQTSGDTRCVMRYTNYALAWCHLPGHCRHLTEVPALVGDTFCNSATGTNVNAPPPSAPPAGGPAVAHFRNDASTAGCLGQMRVKDW